LAKIIVGSNEAFPVGKNVAVVVKNKDLVPQFDDFSEGAARTLRTAPPPPPSPPAQQ
jgi:hypothetical protein